MCMQLGKYKCNISDAHTTKALLTYAVEGLFLSIKFYSRSNDSSHGINVKVFPVSVSCSGLQEGIADLSIHSLV